MSEKVWGSYRGLGPALLVAGGSLFVGWLSYGRQGTPAPSLQFDAVYGVASIVLMTAGAILVYQAQRIWVSQKGSETAPP